LSACQHFGGKSAWEIGKVRERRRGKLGSHSLGHGLLLLLIYFDLFTIAIYISSSRSAEWLKGGEIPESKGASVQSNKIKLGFIDPFQFDLLPFPLTPLLRHSLLCMATKLKCFY